MKNIVIFSIAALIFSLFLFFSLRTERKMIKGTRPLSSSKKGSKKLISSPQMSKRDENKKMLRCEKGIFVPYWSVRNGSRVDAKYDVYYLFPDPSSNVIEKLVTAVPSGKEKFLVVNLTNSESGLQLLESEKEQEELISKIMREAIKYNLQGIALDLEVSSVFSSQLSQKINNFVKKFYTRSHKNDLTFRTILFGDVFYRKRPYDPILIGKYSDKVLVMAYDLFKLRGVPGPNFPLKGRERYGYDLEQMLSDFSKYIDVSKLEVIFGMYGHDWIVDKEGRPIEQANSLSLRKIKNLLTRVCKDSGCARQRDKLSQEVVVRYSSFIEEEGKKIEDKHILWFDDSTSLEEKEKFLRENGVCSFDLWAWGYY